MVCLTQNCIRVRVIVVLLYRMTSSTSTTDTMIHPSIYFKNHLLFLSISTVYNLLYYHLWSSVLPWHTLFRKQATTIIILLKGMLFLLPITACSYLFIITLSLFTPVVLFKKDWTVWKPMETDIHPTIHISYCSPVYQSDRMLLVFAVVDGAFGHQQWRFPQHHLF